MHVCVINSLLHYCVAGLHLVGYPFVGRGNKLTLAAVESRRILLVHRRRLIGWCIIVCQSIPLCNVLLETKELFINH